MVGAALLLLGAADWLHLVDSPQLGEALVEAIESRTYKFRIVDEGLMKQSYNEVQIDDGVLYIQVKSIYSCLRIYRLWQKILTYCKHLPSTLRRTFRTSEII